MGPDRPEQLCLPQLPERKRQQRKYEFKKTDFCKCYLLDATFICPTVHFSALNLRVDSTRLSVVVARGDNATVPCRFWYEPELSVSRDVRVKWTWQPAAGGLETEVLVATGSRTRNSEEFGWVRTCVCATR